MYQNLRTATDPESVHLCEYPNDGDNPRDPELSSTMGGLLRLVREAMTLRNQSKQKVRQPLSTLIVQPGNARERQALERFSDLLREEVNVERVLVHDRKQEKRDLLTFERKNNYSVIRQWRPNEAQQIIKKVEAGDVVEVPGTWSDGPPMLSVNLNIEGQLTQVVLPFEAVYAWKAPEGWEKFAGEPGQLQLLLDARITDELKLKGLARDVIRLVQDHRKNSGLNIEDRIALYLHTDAEKLRAAIEAHREHIAAETLTTRWATEPVGEVAEVKVEGQPLRIGLQRVS
jgi:isoleucyl-tRNA synthetase